MNKIKSIYLAQFPNHRFASVVNRKSLPYSLLLFVYYLELKQLFVSSIFPISYTDQTPTIQCIMCIIIHSMNIL